MFSDLYSRVQERNPRISSRWLRDQVIDLTHLVGVREQWTSAFDTNSMRGMYVQGPLGQPVPVEENEALIVLARSLDRVSRRFVYTKELMHAFDTPEEMTDSSEKFDLQIERLSDPTVDPSPQYRAELKAFFRALAVFCPEHHRLEFKKAINEGETSIDVVATRIGIPKQYTEHLFRDDYPAIIKHITEQNT